MFAIYTLLGAFLRRWYGGLFPDDKYKILGNRGLQTACMLLTFLSIYVTDVKSWQNWLVAIVVSCWLQFQFWSRGHGEPADCGRHQNITEEDIKRYNERWYHIPCDFLLKDHKYGFLYDFIYLNLRYACPMIPMIYFDWRYILVGLSVAPIYAFCMTLQERESWIFKYSWMARGWSLAEIICGGVVFGCCYLLGL